MHSAKGREGPGVEMSKIRVAAEEEGIWPFSVLMVDEDQ
jgi:hypothetical protein